MTLPTRPRAPWHSPTTRRIAVLRIGLPTLLACVFAAGPAMATEAPELPTQATAIVTGVATAARRTLDPPHREHGSNRSGLRSGNDER